MADGSSLAASAFAIAGEPRLVRTPGNPAASRYAARVPDTSIAVDLIHAPTGAKATWRAIASSGATYLRQELTLAASAAPLPVRSVQMAYVRGIPDVLVHGSCDGSPAIAGNLFFAIEHPFAQSEGVYDRIDLSLPRKLDVLPGASLVASYVVAHRSPLRPRSMAQSRVRGSHHGAAMASRAINALPARKRSATKSTTVALRSPGRSTTRASSTSS